MQQTTNYNLKKIELTDSPPDITVINPNWDAIDTELKAIRDADVAHKADYGYYKESNDLIITDILNDLENLKLGKAPITISLKGLSLKNELNYDRKTWAEWIDINYATVENNCLVVDNNSMDVSSYIKTELKPSTKYAILVNIPTNTRTKMAAINSSKSGSRPFSSTVYIELEKTGNMKFIITTQASPTRNEYGIYAEPNSGRIEYRDIRIFELPAGSQIEQDFTNLSADELVIKYPYIRGGEPRGTISANRITSIRNGEIKKAYIPYVGELKSDSTSYDEIVIQGGSVELIRRIGVETPTITPIALTGNITAGEIHIEPIALVKGIYSNEISVTHTDLPILTIDSMSKIDGTILDKSKAVIAENRLSFTHPDLTDGDIVSFDYFYDKQGTKGTLEITIPEPTPTTPLARVVKKKLYSFGVVSDIHLKDINVSPDNMSSLVDYQKALTYYKENEVDFVCIPGDIVANYSESPRSYTEGEIEWVNELNLFKTYNQTYFTGKEVHHCTGNHDATPTGYGFQGLDRIVPSYGNGTKIGEQVYEEITGRPLNYTFTKNDDVFIFFSMYYYNYANFCRQQDITWLSEQLETNKDKRVFLFFHAPLPDTFEPSSVLTVTQGNRAMEFKNLIESYKNIIWFSGHSHYDLRLEAEYPNVNIFKGKNLPTMVHCPSGAYLRIPDGDGWYYNVPNGSQGYVVDVYYDYIVVNGIDFTKGTNGTAISIAHYLI